MPTQLNGVSVKLNGEPAYVYFYCSAATDPACPVDQINVLTPPDLPTGGAIAATTGAAGVQEMQVGVSVATPSFLRFGASRYVAASNANYSLAGPVSLYPGPTTPARLGETVLLWGAGFGPAMTITPGSAIQSGAMPEKIACAPSRRVGGAGQSGPVPGESDRAG